MSEFKEIGGYLELDKYNLSMLHEHAVALNCGRNCLAYLIEAKKIKRLMMPRFICDSVTNTAKKYGVEIRFYEINREFEPVNEIKLNDEEWLYLVNYYGQFDENYYLRMLSLYKRVIIDQTQAYFEEPIVGADCIYTCRKYFGVADGAFLYTNSILNRKLSVDESFERIKFVLGRYERNAEEFYEEACNNNSFFDKEPIKEMSKLTKNLLHAIDYKQVEFVRRNNFIYLHNALGKKNELNIKRVGTFMYPFMAKNGQDIRKKLQKEKIYIPQLWPEIAKRYKRDENESLLATRILPLPIDQRYGINEMDRIVQILCEYI